MSTCTGSSSGGVFAISFLSLGTSTDCTKNCRSQTCLTSDVFIGFQTVIAHFEDAENKIYWIEMISEMSYSLVQEKGHVKFCFSMTFWKPSSIIKAVAAQRLVLRSTIALQRFLSTRTFMYPPRKSHKVSGLEYVAVVSLDYSLRTSGFRGFHLIMTHSKGRMRWSAILLKACVAGLVPKSGTEKMAKYYFVAHLCENPFPKEVSANNTRLYMAQQTIVNSAPSSM